MLRTQICAYDIATRDKIPLIRKLMSAKSEGTALDIGAGTGYTTYNVFGNRPTVCVDLHEPNLSYYRNSIDSTFGTPQPLCVVAQATALPFRSGVFRFILCSEVLEHIQDDSAAVGELGRVLASDGRAVITVPCTRLGFTSFLELSGIKTVHDFPGPEQHVRPGYDKLSLGRLLCQHGLEIECQIYYLRFFTRLVTDLVSLAHLLYQGVVHHRRAWSWSETAFLKKGLAFRFYAWVFPILWAFSRLDRLLGQMPGFGLVASVRKRLGEEVEQIQ